MAPPDGAAVSDDAMGLTQRELLMEMREDIKGLKATIDAIAKDQALGVGMTGRGKVAGEVRKTGRGERRQTSTTDLNIPITWPLPIRVGGPKALPSAAA
jgi:hypothetical protein